MVWQYLSTKLLIFFCIPGDLFDKSMGSKDPTEDPQTLATSSPAPEGLKSVSEIRLFTCWCNGTPCWYSFGIKVAGTSSSSSMSSSSFLRLETFSLCFLNLKSTNWLLAESTKCTLCRNLRIFLSLRFYVKSIFLEYSKAKIAISTILLVSILKFLECHTLKFPKIIVKLIKMAVFGASKWQIWFHVKSDWQKNIEISTLWSTKCTLWKFENFPTTQILPI